ncbi:hypothetical protein QTO34_010970 [Cnephaeus nilssonii]|uniref:Uncharacterized protein n=1 Tax=Cnephaeus nilssonii TaxID=3371016 RepID=A0AA40LD04_CNENI|nr:hypothetical protein QTO34_010970 [Eptesicus nilssonii]
MRSKMSLTKEFMMPMALDEMPLSLRLRLRFLPSFFCALVMAFLEPFLAAGADFPGSGMVGSSADAVGEKREGEVSLLCRTWYANMVSQQNSTNK